MASAAHALSVGHTERRRSPRLPNKVTFVVSAESTKEQFFLEEASTVSINAHGALIALTTHVRLGQKLLLISPKTWNKREGRVVRLSAAQGEWTEVAVEFAEAAREFWPDGVPKRDLSRNPFEPRKVW